MPRTKFRASAITVQFPAYTTPKPGSNPPVPVWGAAALAASRERRNAHLIERNLQRVRDGQLR